MGVEEAKVVSEILHQAKMIRHLDLSFNKIGDMGASLLANASSGLTVLKLRENNITDTGATAIAIALHHHGLEELDLSHNNIGSNGSRSIFESLKTSQLERLFLKGSSIKDQDMTHLVKNLPGSKLKVLDIGHNHGLQYENLGILSILGASELQDLEISNCGRLYQRSKILLHPLKLKRLNLEGSILSDETLSDLTLALPNSSLVELSISSSDFIRDSTLKEFYATISLSNIDKVKLSNVKMSISSYADMSRMMLDLGSFSLTNSQLQFYGAHMLIENMKDSRLEFLDLSNNNLGTIFVNDLFGALKEVPTLRTLVLKRNGIGTDSVESIVKFLKVSNVTELDLSYNVLDYVDALEILKSAKNLKTLKLNENLMVGFKVKEVRRLATQMRITLESRLPGSRRYKSIERDYSEFLPTRIESFQPTPRIDSLQPSSSILTNEPVSGQEDTSNDWVTIVSITVSVSIFMLVVIVYFIVRQRRKKTTKIVGAADAPISDSPFMASYNPFEDPYSQGRGNLDFSPMFLPQAVNVTMVGNETPDLPSYEEKVPTTENISETSIPPITPPNGPTPISRDQVFE